MRTAALVLLAILAGLALVGAPVFADGPPEQTGKEDSVVSPLLQQFIQEREGASDQVARETDSGAVTRSQPGGRLSTKDAPAASGSISSASKDDPVRFDFSGNVQVYIHLGNTSDETIQKLRDLGATVEVTNSDRNVVQAWAPITALDDIAALDVVQEITSPDYAETKAGSVITVGDGIHRADLVRTFSGVTGRGVKVGVISDGVDARRTAQASGDLPSSIEIDPHRSGSGDEGTALLEIVHDLAPGAELAFSGPDTSLEMAESILWLANDAFNGEGADVIVDDYAFYLEPYYEDGIAALAAAEAVAGGAVFVSAAGNLARRHYEGQFSDGGNGYHDFDDDPNATDIALRIDVGRGLFLQWNDQFGSSNNDYDLFLCPPGLKPVKFNLQNDVCEASNREQDGDDDPYENIYTLFTPYLVADVYIRKYSGAARSLKLLVPSGAVLQHGVAEGGIFGHPAAEGVLAVGAINASDPGNDDPEPYSDGGPVEFTSQAGRPGTSPT